MSAPHIEINQDGITAEIFIDGKKLNGVRKIGFEYECKNHVPVLKLELLATDMSIDTQVIPELPEVYKGFYKKIEPTEE